MPLFVRLWQRVYLSVATMSWSVLGALFFGHALLSYTLFTVAGEEKLVASGITFAYFYMTTATTVAIRAPARMTRGQGNTASRVALV